LSADAEGFVSLELLTENCCAIKRQEGRESYRTVSRYIHVYIFLLLS